MNDVNFIKGVQRFLSDGGWDFRGFREAGFVDNFKKMVPFFLGLFVFLNIFPHTTTLKEICFYLALLGAVLSLDDKDKTDFIFKTPLTVPLFIFVAWSSVTVVFAYDKLASLDDFYTHLIKYIFLYYMLVNYFDDRNKFLLLAKLILISVSVFSVATLFYYYIWQGFPILSKFGKTFTDSAINVMGFATVFAMLIAGCFLLTKKESFSRWFLWSVFVVNAMSSLLTQSRGSIIALVISSLILFMSKKRSLLIIAGIFIFLFFSPVKSRFSVEGILNDPRTALAAYSYEVIKDYPWLGTGYSVETAYLTKGDFDTGRYLDRLPKNLQNKLGWLDYYIPHNMLLNFCVRVGVPGLFIFSTIFAVFIKQNLNLAFKGRDDFVKCWSKCLLASISVIIIKGLFEPITTHFVEVIYFTVFAMGTILWRDNFRLNRSKIQSTAIVDGYNGGFS